MRGHERTFMDNFMEINTFVYENVFLLWCCDKNDEID